MLLSVKTISKPATIRKKRHLDSCPRHIEWLTMNFLRRPDEFHFQNGNVIIALCWNGLHRETRVRHVAKSRLPDKLYLVSYRSFIEAEYLLLSVVHRYRRFASKQVSRSPRFLIEKLKWSYGSFESMRYHFSEQVSYRNYVIKTTFYRLRQADTKKIC